MNHLLHPCVAAIAGLLATLACGADAMAQSPEAGAEKRPPMTPVLETFDFAGVSLDGGLLRTQLDQCREYYLQLTNDDLLRGFRARAGRPVLGVELGGWYSADVFHVFGQIVSGLARLHAATGDVACKEKVHALVHGFGECIADDGWFFASRKPNALHYIFDKVVGGLVDAQRWCGDQEALPLLQRVVRWGEQNLARDRRPGDTGTEWYTLSENLYRAFLATHEPRYREFARVWEYTSWWETLRTRSDPFAAPPPPGYHAYSHVNTLGGAAAAYEVTGEARYLETIVAAHDTLWQQHSFATGGFGPDEQLLPATALRARLSATHATFENQCGSWAVCKLCRQLLRFTGEARFGDWVERLCYNAIAAGIPAGADGRVFYYADYCPLGGSKVLHPEAWTCCTGTRPQVVASVVDLVYLHAGDDLHVNLFVPSTLRFRSHGTAVTVTQRTAFPESEAVELTVALAAPVAFAIRVRAPAWLRAPIEARVNGEAVAAAIDAHGWLAIARQWRDGDRLSLRVPMPLWSQPLQAGSAYPAAILCGPVVLAVRSTGPAPHGAIDLARLQEVLEPCAGEPLTFHVAGAPALLVRPFYASGAGQRYFLYLDPALRNRIDHSSVTFTGAWRDAGRFRFSNSKDAAAEVAFTGTGIRWLGWRFDDGGIAEVTIDGKVTARVDQYGPGRDLPFDWQQLGLAPGAHVLRIRLTGEHAQESKDRYLNVAGFEVVDGK